MGLMRSHEGQALVEVVVGIGIWVSIFCVTGKFLNVCWQRARCAHMVFEATHAARLRGASLLTTRKQTALSVEVMELPDRYVGRGMCAGVREEIALPKLEAAQW